VVIKVGSGVLTRRTGLNLNVIDDLTTDIARLREKKIEVLLVSSGAIAAGMRRMSIAKRPESLSQLQALAAIGQSSLIGVYEEAFARHGIKASQILLTQDDLTHRKRYLNARNAIRTLLAWNFIPVINENDAVVVDEIRFGDNDHLSAMVTNLIGADLMINLTNTEGLFDKDPRSHDDAKLLKVVEKVSPKMIDAASKIPGALGSGGMSSKVIAAQKVAMGGAPTIIANGEKTGILTDLFAGKPLGTLVLPQSNHLKTRQHWIAYTKSPKGRVVVDAGARRALTSGKKSLLPSGVKAVQGRFSEGNSVEIVDENETSIAFGLVNYRAGDLDQIKGVKTDQIESILGYRGYDEVVHRDNMILTSKLKES
jgi:glutamate 5-kinase